MVMLCIWFTLMGFIILVRKHLIAMMVVGNVYLMNMLATAIKALPIIANWTFCV